MKIDKDFLYQLVQVAQQAGQIIMEYYSQKKFKTYDKEDSSPVTDADFEASEYIENSLIKLFPNIPVLSEESRPEKFKERLEWNEYFLVDPLDGTKEFIKKSDEFTVNIALIRDGVPIAGVIDAPALGETFYGHLDESFVTKNGMEFKLPLDSYDEKVLKVVFTKSHNNYETEQYISNLEKKYPKVQAIRVGSSLKICRVAEGVADLNPRLGTGTKEWDIAAGHAILKGVGGEIVEVGTRIPVKYSKPSLLNPEYEAKRKELYQSLDC